MINSKLIELYNCLNTQELEAFHKWVRSPLHNNDERIKSIYIFLFSRRLITKTSVQKGRVFNYIFPSENYDDLKLRRLMSKATRCLEEFIQFWMFQKNMFERQKYLISYLKKQKK